MDLRIVELWSSRELGLELEGADAVAEYHVQGTTDEEVAYAAVAAFAPTFRWGLRFRRLKITPVGGPHWTARVEYGVSQTGQQVPAQGGLVPPPPPPPAPAGTDALTDADGISFTTIGETVKVFTSVATVSAISLKGGHTPDVDDFQRKIGASGEGADVFSGRLQMTFTRNMPALTLNYVATLRNLTGKTNEGTWRGVFADSSCLFLGAEGQYRGPEGWVVTYQLDVAGEDSLRDKDGTVVGTLPPHHYAWFHTEKVEAGSGKPTEVPIAVYIEQVYEKADFDQLGI